MDPKTLFLLAFVIFRMDRAFRTGKTIRIADFEERKNKSSHRETSIILSLQSTDPVMTSLCLKPKTGWCNKMDDVFVIPYQYTNWHKPTDQWLISHFSKMVRRSEHVSTSSSPSQWRMFSFDDNYIFVEKLIKELSKFDSSPSPIYFILKDHKAEYYQKPILIFSQLALNLFYHQHQEKCDENLSYFDEWLTSCMTVPPVEITVDRNGKSRIFAMERHLATEEMAKWKLENGGSYDDGKMFISSHSSSLLAFTNLNEIDLKILPILVEKIQ